MTPGPLAVPARVFAELSRGRATPEACDLLVRAQHSKHLLLLRVVLDETVRRRHPQAAATRDAYDLLTAVESAAPGATARVIRYPTVGAWALRTIWHLLQGHPPERCGAAQPYRLAALAASAALLGGVELTVDLPVSGGAVHLPGAGRIAVPRTRTVRLRVGPGGEASVRGTPAELHRPHPVNAPPGAVLDDLDPFRFPPGARPSRRLGPARVAAWTGPLVAGWDLLLDRHLDVAAEVGRLVSVLVPLASTRRRMVSASSRACFGGVALSRPYDALNAALTLAHEVRHVKLSALMDLFPLAVPDTRLYYAPWRDDPRPLHGLLHGAYAFTGVAEFWERQRQLDTDLAAHTRFARWRDAAAETVPVLLGSGALTELGQEFVMGMGDRLDELAKESVPPHAVTLAHRAAARHRERWLRAHG